MAASPNPSSKRPRSTGWPSVLATFADTAKSFFDLKVENSKQSRTLAAMRDALLPKLLSGAVRVRDAETMVEARI
jgi:type I restriction enzyme S subunit